MRMVIVGLGACVSAVVTVVLLAVVVRLPPDDLRLFVVLGFVAVVAVIIAVPVSVRAFVHAWHTARAGVIAADYAITTPEPPKALPVPEPMRAFRPDEVDAIWVGVPIEGSGTRKLRVQVKQLQAVIEQYPNTERSALMMSGAITGAGDHSTLTVVLEALGWWVKDRSTAGGGKGRPATWIVTPERAKADLLLRMREEWVEHVALPSS